MTALDRMVPDEAVWKSLRASPPRGAHPGSKAIPKELRVRLVRATLEAQAWGAVADKAEVELLGTDDYDSGLIEKVIHGAEGAERIPGLLEKARGSLKTAKAWRKEADRAQRAVDRASSHVCDPEKVCTGCFHFTVLNVPETGGKTLAWYHRYDKEKEGVLNEAKTAGCGCPDCYAACKHGKMVLRRRPFDNPRTCEWFIAKGIPCADTRHLHHPATIEKMAAMAKVLVEVRERFALPKSKEWAAKLLDGDPADGVVNGVWFNEQEARVLRDALMLLNEYCTVEGRLTLVAHETTGAGPVRWTRDRSTSPPWRLQGAVVPERSYLDSIIQRLTTKPPEAPPQEAAP